MLRVFQGRFTQFKLFFVVLFLAVGLTLTQQESGYSYYDTTSNKDTWSQGGASSMKDCEPKKQEKKVKRTKKRGTKNVSYPQVVPYDQYYAPEEPRKDSKKDCVERVQVDQTKRHVIVPPGGVYDAPYYKDDDGNVYTDWWELYSRAEDLKADPTRGLSTN